MSVKKALENVLYPLLTLVAVMVIWQTASAIYGKNMILPSPSGVIGGFFGLLSDGSFYYSAAGTALRSLAGFLIALAFATACCVLASFFRPIKRILSPLVLIFRAMPTMSIILLVIVFMTSATSPVLIGFLIVFPILYSSFCASVEGISADKAEMLRLFRVRKRDVFFSFILPSVLPSALSAMQSAISLNVKVVIAAEVMCYTSKSIGVSMMNAQMTADTSLLLSWTVASIALAFLFECLVWFIGKLIKRRMNVV